MSMKVTLGVNKKIGQPNYGSRGASCLVEFELDGAMDANGFERFQQAAQQVYNACRDAVDGELCQVGHAGRARINAPSSASALEDAQPVFIYSPPTETAEVSGNSAGGSGSCSNGRSDSGIEDGDPNNGALGVQSEREHSHPAERDSGQAPLARKATDKQVRMLHVLARQHGQDLCRLVRMRYRLADPKLLDCKTASHLIDQLSQAPTS